MVRVAVIMVTIIIVLIAMILVIIMVLPNRRPGAAGDQLPHMLLSGPSLGSVFWTERRDLG